MEWGGRTKPFWGLCQFAHTQPSDTVFFQVAVWEQYASVI